MEKHRAIQIQIHSVIINQDEITDQAEINKQIFSFYQSLFSQKFQTDIIDAYLWTGVTNQPAEMINST